MGEGSGKISGVKLMRYDMSALVLVDQLTIMMAFTLL